MGLLTIEVKIITKNSQLAITLLSSRNQAIDLNRAMASKLEKNN
ncbi:MAG: hypothetical protein WA919_28165 [Coleofasciculaceae cyanobacterium]